MLDNINVDAYEIRKDNWILVCVDWNKISNIQTITKYYNVFFLSWKFEMILDLTCDISHTKIVKSCQTKELWFLLCLDYNIKNG